MERRPLAAILTLGCKLNLADSEEIARSLRAAGYDVVDRVCEADAFVVNTCSVTHVADAKSRRLVRSVRRLSPGAAVAVTGCFPQSAGFEAAQALGADLVVGMADGDRRQIVAFLGGRSVVGAPAQCDREGLRTRAFVRAQAGCNDVCAFCIVPRTRGREESRPVDMVIEQVARAVEGGAREVVITGTQLGAWGPDLEPSLKPHHLIASILERTEVARLRFSSLQPQDISPELLGLWQDPRLMPHFHLALQSGSDSVLRAMRRRYSTKEFLDAAVRIRAAVPDAAITTDVIAGFPGESEADFEDTLRLCEQAEFARMHCFPYSPRQRTAAAGMAAQVPVEVRKERVERLQATAERLSARFRSRFAGSVRPVLWEGRRQVAGETPWHGYSDNYLPVYFDVREGDSSHIAGTDLSNRVTPVEIGEVYHDGVRGYFPGSVS